MKKRIVPLIKKFVQTKWGWGISKLMLRFTESLRYEKSKSDAQLAEEALTRLFKDLTVQEGYFKGLKYPGFSSFGSSLFPKLSGSYESELHAVFSDLEKNKYSCIIDIGCAEGFYAAGLGLKFPAAEILAFDIDEKARDLCKEICDVNGITGRIEIRGECTPGFIGGISASTRNLIISDCEGYERKLFNAMNIPALVNSDLVIELHPMYEKNVKEYLSSLFSETHFVEFVTSYDDNRKIFDLPDRYRELNQTQKIKLVQEGRAFSMDWLIALSKKQCLHEKDS